MENKKLKLPTDVQTFEIIRTGGYIYVDKTQYLVNLIDRGRVYFLARPRRFGKSLTVSTFEALFSGRRELFKGLYAEEFFNRANFKPNPVISLDMSKIVTGNGIGGIRESLVDQMHIISRQHGVSLPDSKLPGILFNNLIINVGSKYNQRVVVLVDEYDAPYTEFVNDTDMANEVRTELRDFYKQLKANDDKIRFIFITGISKFARFGVFSTLNNTTDISLKPEYAAICGYTEEDIVKYFPDYLCETADEMEISTEDLLDKMRHYYNGFCFDRHLKTRLYNPFSTLQFFDDKDFADYWVESGRSQVIADYLKKRKLNVEQFRNISIPASFARSPGDVDTTPPEGFLYQCGYLTLRPGKATGKFSLDYPNIEVLNAMSRLLIQNIVTESTFNTIHDELTTAVTANDVKEFVRVINRLLARIPYEDYTKYDKSDKQYKQAVTKEKNSKKINIDEGVYRSWIFTCLYSCGINVIAEMHTNKGRSDLVFSCVDNLTTWVVELKVARKEKNEVPAEMAKEALRQIYDNNYAAPFSHPLCVGMAIDSEKRLITATSQNKN